MTTSVVSAATVAVAATSVVFPSLYTFTTSPASTFFTVIVSSAPVLLFTTLIFDASGATVVSASYAFSVRSLL